MKSTVAQIRERFDNDVERFSNLETGQSATIDAPLVLDLIAQAAAASTPHASSILDIGCGAGNYTLKLMQALSVSPFPGGERGRRRGVDCTLLDLSRPMLDRAVDRVSKETAGQVRAIQGDIREVDLGEGVFDIVVAAAVLHHLRDEAEWRAVVAKLYAALRTGGSFWISDLVTHTTPTVQEMMWRRYGEFLAAFKGDEYRDHVFAYIEQEDTPQPLMFQIDCLREAGFRDVELLHKNSCFAAFGAFK